MTILLLIAVGLLAYSNGANDNFKGVASLFGSRACDYRAALGWATVTTFAGSLAAAFVAQALLRKFSGKGLVPDSLAASPEFLMAVAFGAGATVLLATWLGFPISTTHGLTGALVGAGMVASKGAVNFGVLGTAFVLPLLLSPLLAAVTGALVYVALRFARLRLGLRKEMCVCVGSADHALPLLQPDGVFAAQRLPAVSGRVGTVLECSQHYVGRLMGIRIDRLLEGLHFLSAGAVSFSRGLNDTPKIAALLWAAGTLDVRVGLAAVALAIAVGGLLNARRIAETMSHRITDMNSGQGLASNLSTAMLVTTASLHGMPVSTTHVSVGSLLGMGWVTGQAKWKSVTAVLASWVVALPCAALCAALAYDWLA